MFSAIFFYSATVLGHLAFVAMFLIIGDLSKILGNALKKKPYYKVMYSACAMVLVGLIFSFTADKMVWSLLFDLLGVLQACFVTYYYWKWLPADLAKG